MVIWKITGETSSESGGGTLELLAVTANPVGIPDPHAALKTADPAHAWYSIRSIERIAELPDAWRADDADHEALTRLCEARHADPLAAEESQ